MKTFHVLLLAAAGTIVLAGTNTADAWTRADRVAARHAQGMSWNAPYAHTETGMPVSLIVPPTAHMQVKWGWGVAQSSMTPIYHQFRRTYYGDSGPSGEVMPTPYWPSHTDQFGVYYVRGPW